MMPHAGAILVIQGKMPANKAEAPSTLLFKCLIHLFYLKLIQLFTRHKINGINYFDCGV
jgi:hypothetical protein